MGVTSNASSGRSHDDRGHKPHKFADCATCLLLRSLERYLFQFFYISSILTTITKKRSLYSSFIQLKERLAINPQKRQTVTIEGFVDRVYQNYTPIKSDRGGAEGVARQVNRTTSANSNPAQPSTNLSVPFMLNDHDDNFVCVSAIHKARGLKSVM